MSHHRFSRYTTVVSDDQASLIMSTFTRWSMPYDEVLAGILEEVLDPAARPLRPVAALVEAELVARGLLVPALLLGPDEDEYLDGLEPFTAAHPFFGIAAHASREPPTVAFLGFPSELGSSRPGTGAGPRILRAASHVASLPDGVRNRCIDLGDLDLRRSRHGTQLAALEQAVASLADPIRPLVVGGDHSLTRAVVAGLTRSSEPVWVLHLDQHPDVEAPLAIDPDRRLPLGPLTHATVISHVAAQPGVEGVVTIGVDASQVARSPGVSTISRQEVAEHGVSALHLVPRGARVYVSVDVDVVDRSELSSTGYPAEAGLTVGALIELIDHIGERFEVLGGDLVEYGTHAAASGLPGDAPAAVRILSHLCQAICGPVSPGVQGTQDATAPNTSAAV